jgi:hypothetical protein
VGLAAVAVVAAERGRGTEDPLVLPWIHERERERVAVVALKISAMARNR